jgi:hypothetical protein
MAHDHSGGAAALALAPGVAAAWSPARFGFSSYDVQISVGLSSKRRGAHGNAYLGQQTAQEAAVAAHDGDATSLGSSDYGGLLWCSSGSKKQLRSFTAGSSSSF